MGNTKIYKALAGFQQEVPVMLKMQMAMAISICLYLN